MTSHRREKICFIVILAFMLGMASPLCQKVSGVNLLELCGVEGYKTTVSYDGASTPEQNQPHAEMPCAYCLMSSKAILKPLNDVSYVHLDHNLTSFRYDRHRDLPQQKIFILSKAVRGPPQIS